MEGHEHEVGAGNAPELIDATLPTSNLSRASTYTSCCLFSMEFFKSAVASAISKGPPFPYAFGDRVDVDTSIWVLNNGTKRVGTELREQDQAANLPHRKMDLIVVSFPSMLAPIDPACQWQGTPSKSYELSAIQELSRC